MKDIECSADCDRIHVLFCTNAEYIKHVAVSLASIVDSNGHNCLDIHVIIPVGGGCLIDRLRQSIGQHQDCALRVYEAPSSGLNSFFVSGHVSRETYLRIFSADILPADLEKVVYLDGDVVVVGDLRELWQIELGDCILAAAPDHFRQDRKTTLGLAGNKAYVNAGVLLINLARWREEALTQRLVRYIEKAGTRLELHDQDAINGVLHGNILVLDRRWNVQAPMFRAVRRCFPKEYDKIRAATRRPAIIHYSGAEKPWRFRASVARKRDYRRFKRRTAWRDDRPEMDTVAQRVEFALDCFLTGVGIDYLYVLGRVRRFAAKLGRASGAAGMARRLSGLSVAGIRPGNATDAAPRRVR